MPFDSESKQTSSKHEKRGKRPSFQGEIDWLSGMDSNHDKSLQRALCYHYTTGQTTLNLAFGPAGRKAKVNPESFRG